MLYEKYWHETSSPVSNMIGSLCQQTSKREQLDANRMRSSFMRWSDDRIRLTWKLGWVHVWAHVPRCCIARHGCNHYVHGHAGRVNFGWIYCFVQVTVSFKVEFEPVLKFEHRDGGNSGRWDWFCNDNIITDDDRLNSKQKQGERLKCYEAPIVQLSQAPWCNVSRRQQGED